MGRVMPCAAALMQGSTQGFHGQYPVAHIQGVLRMVLPLPPGAPMEPYPSQPLVSQRRRNVCKMCFFVRYLLDGLRSPLASGGYVCCVLRTLSGLLRTGHCLEQCRAGCIPRLPCGQRRAHLKLCFDSSGARLRPGVWKRYLWRLPVFMGGIAIGVRTWALTPWAPACMCTQRCVHTLVDRIHCNLVCTWYGPQQW